jgi:hypothetical protein
VLELEKSWKNRLAVSKGQKPIDFTANQLDRMGVELEKIVYCSKVYDLPKPDG